MKLIWVWLCILAGVASAWADDSTCAELNGAYEHAVNTGRYQTVSTVTGKGQDSGKLWLRTFYYDQTIYVRRPYFPWLSYRRGTLDHTDDGRSVFQNCTKLGTETMAGNDTTVFQTDWQRYGDKAVTKLWFSTETGKLAQTERFFTALDENSFYSGLLGQSVLDRYAYDGGLPPPLEAYKAYLPTVHPE